MVSFARCSVICLIALVGVTASLASQGGKGSYIRGKCSTYGLCGKSKYGIPGSPCVYNGPPKLMVDPTARKLLASLCPHMKYVLFTCCDLEQLEILAKQIAVPAQLLSRCPACFYNFKNTFCNMVCSPDQHRFLAVTDIQDKTTVNAVQYDLSTHFASGMYTSCQNVHVPATEALAMGIMCGRPAKECTAQRLLDFMGDPDNGQAPFKIDFKITDKPDTLPSGVTLYPMDAKVIPCQDPVGKSGRCTCKDCNAIPCPTIFSPALPCTRQKSDFIKNGDTGFVPISLVIQRKGNFSRIKHPLPPPASTTDVVYFNAVFKQTFLHRMLSLVSEVKALTVRQGHSVVTLDNVCQHANGKCVLPSPLQYFQNVQKNIDKINTDGFYIYADYLDHFQRCFSDNTGYDKTLNMSCLADYMQAVAPSTVFCGYDGLNFKNSTAFLLTFVIQDPAKSESAAAWKQGMYQYIDQWLAKNKDVLITKYEP